MTAPARLLFVCTANACRSVIAEQLTRRWAAERGLPIEADSRGLAAESWYAVPAPARRLLADAGIAVFSHRPRLLTRDALRWADVALVMARGHRELARERFPEFSHKIRLLKEYAGLAPGDIADPTGGGDEDFAACFREISEALEALLRDAA